MKFSRFGGLNNYKQDLRRSPERKGFFAFIFGYEDLFLLTGMNTGKYKKYTGSFDKKKLGKKKVFSYQGTIYVSFIGLEPKFYEGCKVVRTQKRRWIKTTTKVLEKGFWKNLRYLNDIGEDYDCVEVFIPNAKKCK